MRGQHLPQDRCQHDSGCSQADLLVTVPRKPGSWVPCHRHLDGIQVLPRVHLCGDPMQLGSHLPICGLTLTSYNRPTLTLLSFHDLLPIIPILKLLCEGLPTIDHLLLDHLRCLWIVLVRLTLSATRMIFEQWFISPRSASGREARNSLSALLGVFFGGISSLQPPSLAG